MVRAIMWITAAIFFLGAAAIVYALTRGRVALPNLGQGALGLSDMAAVASLVLNFVLLLISVAALFIAVAAYQAGERSGRDQQITLEASRRALENTSDILKTSAKDFRDSADAARGQYMLLQQAQAERDRAISFALQHELGTNINLLSEIKRRLQVELTEAIPKGETLVSPLPLLHTGAWELLKVSLPPRLLKSEAGITKVADAYRIAEMVNEELRSRENYRIHNQAMDNFTRRIGLYDQLLMQMIPSLEASLKDLKNIIGSAHP